MSSEAPTAAWHPAMMPNADKDIVTNPKPVSPPATLSPSLEACPTQPGTAGAPGPTSSSKLLDASEHTSAADEWFPDYEAGSPWKQESEQPRLEEQGRDVQDAQVDTVVEPNIHQESEPEPEPGLEQQYAQLAHDVEPAVAHAPDEAAQQAAFDPTAESRTQEESDTILVHQDDAPSYENIEAAPDAHFQPDRDETAAQEEAPIPSGPNHISKESFARTVSEQPNLEDDEDEAPWNLPRADTDLFKFMPPNSRTNSFPVVPLLEHQQQHGHVRQLSTVQAEDIVNEMEHESENLDFDDSPTPQPAALEKDDFWGDDATESAFPVQLGGEIHNPEEEASDARYAEGVPLINSDQGDGAPGQEEVKTRDPFAEDDPGEGDDFFAQIGGGANATDDQEFHPPKLDRKSTTQVIQELNGNHATAPGSKLDSPEEEDEGEFLNDSPGEDQQVGPLSEEVATAAESTTVDPQEQHGEDLASKWSQAFAEDEDDDFLLEDHPVEESKEDKTIDPSAFLIDDDEGFLEDSEEQVLESAPLQTHLSASQANPPPPAGVSNKYLPAAAAPVTRQPSNPYFPSTSPMVPQPQTFATNVPAAATSYGAPAAQPPAFTPYGAPAARPVVNKGQSFADKSKGGYQSPYDLPMDVVKPRKRQTTQQLPRGGPAAPPGPPVATRSPTIGAPPAQGPPGQAPPPQVMPQGAGSFASPPASIHSGQSPSLAKPPQQPSSKTGFFEDLPMSQKARPLSRTSNKSQVSPLQATFNGPPQAMQPSPLSMPTPPQDASFNAPSTVADFTKLVPPAPMNPYAALPAASTSAPSVLPPVASRYSPALAPGSTPNGVVPAPSRYSPAPPAQRVASYGPNATTQPTALPHLPRTSSPLAHFEARPSAGHGDQPSQLSRGASTFHEPRLHRVPSLPPTREVEEEDTVANVPPEASGPRGSQVPPRARQNGPPSIESSDPYNMSPPKRRISYGPVPLGTGSDIEPPPRSQTGSPSALYGLRSPIKASETNGRPSSAQGHVAPPFSRAYTQPNPAPMTTTRPRGFSQKLNLIPPTDGRELDPLQRWKGVPLISWGVGGTLVTSFPVDVPRYGMNQVGPMIVRSPGEIKVKTIREVSPLEERLAKFPGPLKGKSKKKETVAWLTAGIEELEKTLPNLAFQTQLAHEDKRVVERVLLWKILRILIENDGMLEGNPTVDKAVRDVLSLTPSSDDSAPPIYASGSGFGGAADESSTTQMQTDSVDSGTIQRLKKSLLAGDREKAVWDAADKRLWGHALLIANTVSSDLYHKVSQEFIKKEVNFPGHNNESLAALYSVLSGNHEESVDELVPTHARAGVQLLATSTGPTSSSGMDGLEKWRETLTLILSNRSPGDAQAVNSLGNLLATYGRAEAAHICFLFARSVAVFGGLDDPRAQFVLVGADHRTQSQQFFKETEPLLLSEVYEYGLSLTGTPSYTHGVAHLSVYKLQHAVTLAEHGFRDKALQYCEVIMKDMTAQTRRSPYHHVVLESAVENLRQRLMQAPNKENSNSWISKPSMDKVSSSVWSRFNKFVAGEEVDAPGQGSPKQGEETGPFAGLQGGTPTVSRPPSATGVTGMDMFSSPTGYPGAPSLAAATSPILTRSASRYAPASAQSPAGASPYNPATSYAPSGRSSMERTSGEYNRSPYEPRHSSEFATGPPGGYVPPHSADPTPMSPESPLGISNNGSYQAALPNISTATSAPAIPHPSGPQTPSYSYTPFSEQTPLAPVADSPASYAPVTSEVEVKPAPVDGQGYGYESPSLGTAADQLTQPSEEPAPVSSVGYEPPSFQPYGYEPPSYQPDAGTSHDDIDDGPRPKKKSFMDDDDDDNFPSISASQTAPKSKSKSEKDKENEELFRKVAEEDAKRAEEEKAAKAKKGWGFGGWFGGAKKDSLDSAAPNKPIRAKLGEKSSFIYDPEQKRWVNKAAGAEDQAPKTATPPPPRGMIPRANSTMPPSSVTPPSSGTPPPPSAAGGLAVPPPNQRTVSMPQPSSNSPTMPGAATPPLMRAVSTASNGPPSAPPSRPATSMSNASSIDDLLGAAAPRKGGAKGKKKGGRYVDVMAK